MKLRRDIPSGRRAVLLGGGAACAVATLSGPRALSQPGGVHIAALFAGRIDDAGFMQAGYQGLKAAEARLGARISHKDGVRPEMAPLAEALRELARAGPDLVVAHGGQNNAAARTVAAEFPALRFAVTQGDVTGPNLASYEVLQEHSAFLAGALAGILTKTGVVGHMSGIRVAPGLKGRAAYAHGVRHANPGAKLLTNFSGDQDDAALAKRVALAMIEAGADVIFTMLNAGRTGAIEACRERGVPQIGNVRDWVAAAPEVFIASAVADSGLALFNAAEDVVRGRFRGGVVRRIGLEQPEAVRLALSGRVPPEVRGRIEALAGDIVAGRVAVPTEWAGEEFASP
jgi:basic membrane protein A and related proteins